MNPKTHRRLRLLCSLLVLVGAVLTVPRYLCGREAEALFHGRREAHEPLARRVAAWVDQGVRTGDFNTGSRLFDAEWVFGTYIMAGLGLLQFVQMYPDSAGQYLLVVERCIDRLLHPETRRFDAERWHGDPMRTLNGAQGHAAYLGYTNLVLGYYRLLGGRGNQAIDANRRISRALARRLRTSRTLLIETYPGETFPVDNAAVAASLVLFDRAEGGRSGPLFAAFAESLRRRYLDPASGMVVQAVDSQTGEARDRPRASGTALAAYFLAFADRALSGELWAALERGAATRFLGFGLMREYPRGQEPGPGDIDSGPVVAGISFSGTGFALAPARIHGASRTFADLYATAYLVGAPFDQGSASGTRTFVSGGPLGNAILLAMLTAGGAR